MAENDIKIYNGSQESTDREIMTEIYTLINVNKQNGNLERARVLGEKLATLNPTKSGTETGLNLGEVVPQQYLVQDILYQMKVLLVFAAEKVMKEEIKPDFLSIMAINAMHDSISKKHPAFFKNLADGAAFTFYRLALQKVGNIEDNIGEAFAMLCNVHKNTNGYIEVGRIVWKMSTEICKKAIAEAGFVKTEKA